MTSSLLIAFALMLVLEGLVPFLSPGSWRETWAASNSWSRVWIEGLFMGSTLESCACLWRAPVGVVVARVHVDPRHGIGGTGATARMGQLAIMARFSLAR